MPLQHIAPGSPGAVADALADEFLTRHGRRPAAVFSAPGRVNLIGEHVDYNGGRCLPIALPHATYAAVAARDDGVLTVASLQSEDRWKGVVEELAPGSVPGWAAYVAGVVWALADAGQPVTGLDLVVDSTVPVGAGLSSSAALTCAVGLAVAHLLGLGDGPEVRRSLIRACMRAEAEMAGAPTGGMDQSVALLAEPGHALLLDFTDGSSDAVPWDPASEDLALLVVDTRAKHELNDGGYAARRTDCETAARVLGASTLRELRGTDAWRSLEDEQVRRRVRHVLSEMDRVDEAVDVLRAGHHAGLGPLLDASHDSLRDDYEVSCAELDEVVDTCRSNGALGARMTGGGFGGSAIALVARADIETTAAAVGAAFTQRGWPAPAFLTPEAAGGGRRVR